MRILVCESDINITHKLDMILSSDGYNVDFAYDGLSAIDSVNNNLFDLIIIDANLRKIDGISVLKEIKKIKDIPVIIISSNDKKEEMIEAYETGAVDYLRKPLIDEEIIYKLRVIFSHKKGLYFKYETFEIDDQKRVMSVDGDIKKLTEKEFMLLVYLISNKNIAVKREKLLYDVWGYGFFGDDRTIDTHIKKIRIALGKYRDLIKTIRGYGYKFEV